MRRMATNKTLDLSLRGLRKLRTSTYNVGHIREFAEAFKNGEEHIIPEDFGEFLHDKAPTTRDEVALWLYVCLEREGLTGTFANYPNQLQPDHTSPVDFIAESFLEEVSDCIVLGPRKGGKTLSFSALMLMESIFKGVSIAHLGAVTKQAERCYKYYTKMLRHKFFSKFVSSKITKTKVELHTKAEVEILVGTMTGVNCFHGDTLVDCARDYLKYPEGIRISELVGKKFAVPCMDIRFGKIAYEMATAVYSGEAPCVKVRLVPYSKSAYDGVYPDDPIELIVTMEQAFLMKRTKKYKRAFRLQPGDKMVTKPPRTWKVRRTDYLNTYTGYVDASPTRIVILGVTYVNWRAIPTIGRYLEAWRLGNLKYGSRLDSEKYVHADGVAWNNTIDNIIKIQMWQIGEYPIGKKSSDWYEFRKNNVPEKNWYSSFGYFYWVESVEPYNDGKPIPVYDVQILTDNDDRHNFFANGVCVHNSPHPVKAQLDEVELMDWDILQEAMSMAASVGKYAAATRLTSTRKFDSGTMQRIIDEAGDRGFRLYKWNLWDVCSQCPMKTSKTLVVEVPETLDNPDKCEEIRVFKDCVACPLLPACRGRAKYSLGGIIPLVDAIKLYGNLDTDIWLSQVECARPGKANRIYNEYDPAIHDIDDYVVDLSKPVYAGQDAGYHCPATIFVQEMEDGVWCVFDEIYMAEQVPSVYIQENLVPANAELNVELWVADPSGASMIAEMQDAGLTVIPGVNAVDLGIETVKGAFKLRRVVISKKCKNLRRELLGYRRSKTGRIIKKEDHACDAFRYVMMEVLSYSGELSEVFY